MSSPQLLAAAAVVLMLGGGMLMTADPDRADTTAGSPLPALPPFPPFPSISELSVGDMFGDLTDSELRSLLDEMATLEAVTPTETEIVLPAVDRSGA